MNIQRTSLQWLFRMAEPRTRQTIPVSWWSWVTDVWRELKNNRTVCGPSGPCSQEIRSSLGILPQAEYWDSHLEWEKKANKKLTPSVSPTSKKHFWSLGSSTYSVLEALFASTCEQRYHLCGIQEIQSVPKHEHLRWSICPVLRKG